MKKIRDFIFLIIGSTLLSACSSDFSENSLGSIVGTVSDKTTGEPISTVNVSLLPGGKSAVTGNDGAFAFVNLTPGDYSLLFNKEGYNANTIDVRVNGSDPSAVHVTLERIPSALTADKSELDFGDALTTLSFAIVNSGYTDLVYQVDFGDVDWLSVDPMEDVLKYGKTATLIVKIDRSKLPDGYNEANIVVRSTSGNGSTEVKVIAVNNSNAAVNTLEVTDITNTSATFNGEIINPGQPSYTERGFVFDTQPTPTTTECISKFSTAVNSNVRFAVNVTGLSPVKTYYVRTYMVQEGNVIYGNIVAFSTSQQATSLTTSAPTNVGATEATFNATIINAGSPPYTEKGFCFSNNRFPTIADTRRTVNGNGTGNFSLTVTNLDYPETYYVRAYAIQSGETIYGNIVSFSTSSSQTEVFTNGATETTSNSTVLNGTIISAGTPPYTEKGFCLASGYNTPSIASNKFPVSGNGTGSFSLKINNLESGTTYQYRVYAIQEGDVVYGNTLSFNTAYSKAQVLTQDITDIGFTSATFNGNVANIGDPRITERGFCYNSNSYYPPTISDNVIKVSGAVAGAYKAEVKGLQEETSYSVRAYVIQEGKPVYGEQKVFETGYAPIIVTGAPANVKSTGSFAWQAKFRGAFADGNPPVTEIGFVYSDYRNPTVNTGTKVQGSIEDSDDGAYYFSRTVTNLMPNKTYYVRAFVKTRLGYTYGEDESFSTY